MDGKQHDGPDCLTCWKYSECGNAEPGKFCAKYQTTVPQKSGKDPNDAWRQGEETDF